LSDPPKSELNQITLNKASMQNQVHVFIQSKDMSTEELIKKAETIYDKLNRQELPPLETG
jgi:hypothetical protein